MREGRKGQMQKARVDLKRSQHALSDGIGLIAVAQAVAKKQKVVDVDQTFP